MDGHENVRVNQDYNHDGHHAASPQLTGQSSRPGYVLDINQALHNTNQGTSNINQGTYYPANSFANQQGTPHPTYTRNPLRSWREESSEFARGLVHRICNNCTKTVSPGSHCRVVCALNDLGVDVKECMDR